VRVESYPLCRSQLETCKRGDAALAVSHLGPKSIGRMASSVFHLPPKAGHPIRKEPAQRLSSELPIVLGKHAMATSGRAGGLRPQNGGKRSVFMMMMVLTLGGISNLQIRQLISTRSSLASRTFPISNWPVRVLLLRLLQSVNYRQSCIPPRTKDSDLLIFAAAGCIITRIAHPAIDILYSQHSSRRRCRAHQVPECDDGYDFSSLNEWA